MLCSPKALISQAFGADGALDRVLQRGTFRKVSAGAGAIQQRESHTVANRRRRSNLPVGSFVTGKRSLSVIRGLLRIQNAMST